MLPMLPSKVLPLFFLFLASNQSLADAYADAREELMAAYQTRDYPAMQLAANDALQARPGYPGALFNLAFAKALDDDPSGALEILERLVASGVDYGVADIEELATLQSLPGWAATPAFDPPRDTLPAPITRRKRSCGNCSMLKRA